MGNYQLTCPICGLVQMASVFNTPNSTDDVSHIMFNECHHELTDRSAIFTALLASDELKHELLSERDEDTKEHLRDIEDNDDDLVLKIHQDWAEGHTQEPDWMDDDDDDDEFFNIQEYVDNPY